jgi:hypothetical protein
MVYFYQKQNWIMRIFSIEGKDNSPSVLIDEARNLLEICGNSTLRDTQWFYGNLMNWMIAFNKGSRRTETVNIRLTRINDSSIQGIALMFKKLSGDILPSDTVINWYIDGKNPRMLSSGKILQRELMFRVNLVSLRNAC